MKIIDSWTTVSKKTGKTHYYNKVEAFNGKIFVIEKPENGGLALIEKDILTVEEIFSKGIENLTSADRMMLLNIYNVAYHTDGKIEDIFSFDSSATNCEFCAKMREYAAKHPELGIVCGECYDYKQEKYRYGTLNRHTLNLVIMETVSFSVEELKFLSVFGLGRVNSSGDSSGNIYAENMIKLCFAHPLVDFAIWSKNTKTYIRACDIYGKPKNCIMIQSSPFINKVVKLAKYFDYTFTVFSDAEKIKEALANGACECNGKKCKACGFKCYKGLWPIGSDIAEFLRK